MHKQVNDEKTELETRLTNAFQETLSKTQLAITETENQATSFVMKIWLATEAAEYTSLLYSLTYDLQDYDPEVEKRRGEDPIALLKDSLRMLKLAVGKQSQGAIKNGYEQLRSAAECLKRVYLDQTKTSTSRRSKPAPPPRRGYEPRRENPKLN